MIDYLMLRTKKIATLFVVPLLVEFLFYLILIITKKNSEIVNFHGIWYLAGPAIVLFVSVYELIKNYYGGHDSLWQVLPYSKELLAFIDIFLYIIGTLIFGIVYQLVQGKATKTNFTWSLYIGPKIISLLSFYLVIMAVSIIFKNVGNQVLGSSLIVALSSAIVIALIVDFWHTNGTSVVHFMVGTATTASLKGVSYLNILPIWFGNNDWQSITNLPGESLVFNIGTIVVCLVIVLLSAKFRKLNYIDLIGG